MKALIQRVLRGNVSVDNKIVGEISRGYVVLLGVKTGDTEKNALYLAHKTVSLRVFPDDNQRMNLSIQDIKGEILVISQFTLYADTKKGCRPSFINAAPPEIAESLYNIYVNALRHALGNHRVSTGIFRKIMTVEVINDGPVTIEIVSA